PFVGHVQGQPGEGAGPADAGRSRPVLGPHVVVDVGDVFQGETGLAVAFFGDADLDPRHLSAELPGGGETVRRVALFDGARGVAFQAVVAPGRRSPLMGRNQRGIRSGFVTASHRSAASVGYTRLAVSTLASPDSNVRVPTVRVTSEMWWATSSVMSSSSLV